MTTTGPAPTSAARRPGRPRDPEVDRAVLDAVVEVLATAGYDALTMDAVAARAGVSRATVYRRYANRGELLLAACEHFSPPPTDPPDTGDVRSDLVELCSSLVAVLDRSDTGRLLPAVFGAAAGRPEVRDVLHRFAANRRRPSLEVIARAVDRGELPEHTDPDLVADLLFGSIVYRRLLRGGSVDRRRIAAAVDVVLHGLSAPAPAPAPAPPPDRSLVGGDHQAPSAQLTRAGSTSVRSPR